MEGHTGQVSHHLHGHWTPSPASSVSEDLKTMASHTSMHLRLLDKASNVGSLHNLVGGC